MGTSAIYGIGVYGDCVYGQRDGDKGKPKYVYKGIPLGLWVRKQIAKNIIFRVCRGNGYAGSKAGVLYQHRYPYFVPSSITHVNGEPARICYKNMVLAWQALTDEQKEVYNIRASVGLHMSGYNLFHKEYFKSNYPP